MGWRVGEAVCSVERGMRSTNESLALSDRDLRAEEYVLDSPEGASSRGNNT